MDIQKKLKNYKNCLNLYLNKKLNDSKCVPKDNERLLIARDELYNEKLNDSEINELKVLDEIFLSNIEFAYDVLFVNLIDLRGLQKYPDFEVWWWNLDLIIAGEYKVIFDNEKKRYIGISNTYDNEEDDEESFSIDTKKMTKEERTVFMYANNIDYRLGWDEEISILDGFRESAADEIEKVKNNGDMNTAQHLLDMLKYGDKKFNKTKGLIRKVFRNDECILEMVDNIENAIKNTNYDISNFINYKEESLVPKIDQKILIEAENIYTINYEGKIDLFIELKKEIPKASYEILDEYIEKDIHVLLKFNKNKSIAQIRIPWVLINKDEIIELYDKIGFPYEFVYKDNHYTLKDVMNTFVS